MNEKPTLVLGIGNKILTDDGIGIRLIEDLAPEFDISLVDFKTACGGGLEIIELMQDYDHVIILDAIKTENGIPGEVSCYSVKDFKETLHISSFHDISFLIALEFGRRSGLKMPDNIQILAIEIVEDMVFSDVFSPSISQKYEHIKTQIYKYLHKQFEISFA